MGAPGPSTRPPGGARRLGWFVLLWASGVLALLALALPLRWLLKAL